MQLARVAVCLVLVGCASQAAGPVGVDPGESGDSNEYTTDTRQWLADQGFPPGPVRLANSFVTLPGSDTVDYKTQTITALEQGLTIAAGVGNRDSDVTAYTNASVPADRIYIKLPEFQSEVQADLDAGKAIGFQAYSDLQSTYVPTW